MALNARQLKRLEDRFINNFQVQNWTRIFVLDRKSAYLNALAKKSSGAIRCEVLRRRDSHERQI